jgi:hypothetical protein
MMVVMVVMADDDGTRAGQVLKMFEGKSVERHNIPEELKELLRCEGRQCAQCTTVAH